MKDRYEWVVLAARVGDGWTAAVFDRRSEHILGAGAGQGRASAVRAAVEDARHLARPDVVLVEPVDLTRSVFRWNGLHTRPIPEPVPTLERRFAAFLGVDGLPPVDVVYLN